MCPDGQSWHCRCNERREEKSFGVSEEVLPRYGFDGSEYGVAQMLEAFFQLRKEPLSDLVRPSNRCLRRTFAS